MQSLSFNSLEIKLRRYPHLNDLKVFLKRIEKEKPELILLYGSLAKGTFTQFSDIDVLCVFDLEFSDLRERFLHSYKYSDGIVQPKTLSYKEFKEGVIHGNSFLYSILKDGIILYSRIPLEDLEAWMEKGKENLKVRFVSPS
ncbi:MAG: nucleotidyltransferase domain-containing protein [Promethearchaeota archaeon]|nr:MAG: nucleotidyltransferase domain-containing protein [Candidatus Lokiarchaeota archaeon]